MKWFKHETDGHLNLKLQAVIEKFGLEGYGYYWSCVELAGKSENFRVKAQKEWKIYFKKFLSAELDWQNKILAHFAEIDLIDKKGLKKGDLYIPKLEKRSDNYTKSVRRVDAHTTNNVALDKIRLDKKKIRREETPKATASLEYLRNFSDEDKTYFVARFAITEAQLRSKCEDLYLYCQAGGYHYKNYKAFLTKALKKDFKERPPKPVIDAPKGRELTPKEQEEAAKVLKEGLLTLGKGMAMKPA